MSQPLKQLRCACLVVLLCLGLAGVAEAAQHITVGGVGFVSLDHVASQLGMDAQRSGDGKSVTLRSKWTSIVFEHDTSHVTLNGIEVYFGSPVIVRDGTFYISDTDYRCAIQALLTPQVFGKPPQVHTIVLDPGHGGKDTGAQNPHLRLQEKALVLDLAGRLKRTLEKRGYRVLLTRSSDDFVELEDRPAKANRLGADLFISLHLNASSSESVSGAETYILPPGGQASTSGGTKEDALPGNAYDPWNALAGYYVQRELVHQVHAEDRGLKRARFVVLKTLHCPGMLVESGFVSNSREGRNLGWDAYRENIANAIADAIDAYKKTLDRVAQQAQ